MKQIRIVLIVLFLLAVPLLLFGIFGRLGSRPSTLGVKEGRLAPCPDSPNCVSSQASPDDSLHYIPAFPFEGSAADARARLRQVIREARGASLVTERRDYFHVEFKVPLAPFVDDVEFLIDEETGRVEVRSASRVGQGDMGVNRRRVEGLRAAFEEAEQP